MRNATEIVMILDKSGSMEALKADAIGGFNTFLREQQAESGEASFTLVLFDTQYRYHPAVPIANARALDDRSYRPGGGTALLDAMGRTIQETGKRLHAMPEADRPDKVIVVTLTDGEENSSHSFVLADVKAMIEHQQDRYAWKFLFLGANQDAFAEAGKLGIPLAMAAQMVGDGEGFKRAYRSLGKALADYRLRGTVGENWKDDVN